jgi:organic radical activating enzyme
MRKTDETAGMKLARMGDGAEIFFTLQGEGVNVGCPAVFVRLSLCNLHCVWCDTDHTWNFVGTPWAHEKDSQPGYQKHCKVDAIIEMDAAQIAALVREYGCRHVVLTGGEPLLQENGLLDLITELRLDGADWFFEMETNGTRLPSNELMDQLGQFNVSPKLANSGVSESLRQKPEVISGFVESGKAWFKFVVEKESDLAEVMALVEHSQIPMNRVILMPEGRNVEEIDKVAPWLAECCRNLGARFSDRLLVRLWGDKRGV